MHCENGLRVFVFLQKKEEKNETRVRTIFKLNPLGILIYANVT